MGDNETQSFNSFLNALNDLAKGQKDMVGLMRGIENKGTSIGKDLINGEGSNSVLILPHKTIHTHIVEKPNPTCLSFYMRQPRTKHTDNLGDPLCRFFGGV